MERAFRASSEYFILFRLLLFELEIKEIPSPELLFAIILVRLLFELEEMENPFTLFKFAVIFDN